MECLICHVGVCDYCLGSKPNFCKKDYNKSHNNGDGGNQTSEQFEDNGIEMEKAIENTESPEKGALGSSSSKKILFKLF